MLARSAQGLYWMSRYLERSEFIARLLELQTRALVDRPLPEIHFGWRRIYGCLGISPPAGDLEPDHSDDYALADSFTLAGDLANAGLRGDALREAVAHQAARHVELAALTEQLPDPANRLLLDPHEKDRYGVPLPRIRYEVDAYARAGLTAARNVHNRIFGSLGCTGIQHHDEFQGAGHVIGTCRMGDDPAISVVDSNLQSHDHHNLHILGSATFPTSGTANPTLTIAALSLRLADRLQGMLGP